MDKFGSVQRRNERQIERLAKLVRQELGVPSGGRIQLQPVYDFALDELVDGAYFRVVNDLEMDGAEGRTDWHQPVITLSASTYAKLLKADDRARMTAAHELGHLLMHSRQPIFFYRTQSKDHRFDPEWQANYFAAALLMPADAFRKMKTVSQSRKAFGVSRAAVLRRARLLSVPIVDDSARRPGGKRKGASSKN